MILYILQNAYKSEKHKFKNEDEWSRELKRSHTGRRLLEMIPEGIDYAVINSSGNIGDDPNSIFEADVHHMKALIRQIKPTVICACGKVAQTGCDILKIKHISAPHPAWRQLSKKLTKRIRKEIEEKYYESTRS